MKFDESTTQQTNQISNLNEEDARVFFKLLSWENEDLNLLGWATSVVSGCCTYPDHIVFFWQSPSYRILSKSALTDQSFWSFENSKPRKSELNITSRFIEKTIFLVNISQKRRYTQNHMFLHISFYS